MENHEILVALQKDIALIKDKLNISGINNAVCERWVPRSEVMKFLNYGPTQIAEFEKLDGIVTSRIGKRKFFLRESVAALLDRNIIDNKSD